MYSTEESKATINFIKRQTDKNANQDRTDDKTGQSL